MTIVELKGDEDYSNTSSVFFIHKVFISYLTLGYAPPGEFLTLQPLRLFLMASETRLGRSLSVISLLFNSQMLDGECVS